MQIKKTINVLGLFIALISPFSSFAQKDSKENEAKTTTPRISKIVKSTPIALRPDISVEKFIGILGLKGSCTSNGKALSSTKILS